MQINKMQKVSPLKLFENAKEEKELKKMRKIAESVKSLMLDSTIQGIPKILRTKRLFFKIMWFSFLFGSGLACGYFVTKTFVDFLEYDTITSIETVIDHQLEFPTFSFCNYANSSFEFVILDCVFNRDKDCKKNWSNHFETYDDTFYGKCYRFNSGKNMRKQPIQIKNSSVAGLYYGFSLDIYVPTERDSSELLIYIHNSTKTPASLFNKGYFVIAGSFYSFAIRRTYEQKLDAPYSSCLRDLSQFPGNQSLINYILNKNRTYSQDECISLCQNVKYLELEKNCNCTLNGLDDVFFATCYKKITDKVMKQCAIDFMTKFQKNPVEICANYCPLECDTVNYEVSQFITPLLSSGQIKKPVYPLEQFNTYENVTKSFFSMNVYYEDLQYLSISKMPKLQVFDLFSSIGGLFGLFLGMSILSFLELIEIFFETFFIVLERKTVVKDF